MWISLLTISAQIPGSPHVQHDKGCCLTFGGGRCHDGLEFPVVTPVCGVGGIGSPVLGLKDEMDVEAFLRPKRLPGFPVFEQKNLKHSAEFGVELSMF